MLETTTLLLSAGCGLMVDAHHHTNFDLVRPYEQAKNDWSIREVINPTSLLVAKCIERAGRWLRQALLHICRSYSQTDRIELVAPLACSAHNRYCVRRTRHAGGLLATRDANRLGSK